MQQVGQRPADKQQWATGTAGWVQRSSDSDIDWTQPPPISAPPHSAGAPGKVLWSSSGETDNAPDSGGAAKSGTVNSTPSSKNSDTNPDKSPNTTMANLSASISWGANSSTSGGLDSSLWGAMNTTATSTSSTWGSSTAPGSLSLNQGQSMQIGASSVGDGQNANGSASAPGWGLSPVTPTGSTGADNSQSQAGSVASNTIGQQSGPSTLANSQSVPPATNTMPWHSTKPFGFTPTSDTSWSNPSSSAMNTTGSTNSKEASSSIVGVLGEPGNLAQGLANLSIGKTPPPDWNAMKTGWNSTMDPSKLPVGAVGSSADISFAQATQKGLKPPIGSIRSGVLSAKEEEIRRAVNTNEGWGTRPVRQDTSWDIESSPKAARKMMAEMPEVAPSNVWNNNNGTAIWESTREPSAPGWGPNAASGGTIFADKDPNNWNMPPKPNMEGTNWGGGGGNAPMMNNPMSDKSIGTWGGESQQSSSKLWGNKTETGSWNEPPPERNMTWGGQDTDVGTWEDPATAAARRIVSSSGVGPMGMGGSGGNGGGNMGSNMAMGGGNMPMAANTMTMGGANMGMPGANNMPMGGANMPMGGANMPMGGANMPMGGGNMPMGGGNMPMGGANMPMGGANMPMGGANMPMGGANMPMGGNMNSMNSMNMAMAGGGAMNMGAGGMGGGNMNMPMGTGNMNMGGGGDSSVYWNDPNAKPQGWNQAGGPPRPKPDEPWNKPGMGRPGNSNGWGDPSGGSSQKVDDGTSIWAANAQEQARAAGWGEPGAMWNPAFGARPKATSWSGGGEQDWQRKLNQQRFPGSSGQPQMRSKLIQQLMDMGFKKEEAQNALISNNMNFESALGELTSGLHKKESDDVFQSGGSKMLRQGFAGDNAGMMGEDLDNRSDSNPHVPNFPMQNTPFNNAQAANPSYMSAGMNMYDHRSKGGPPMPQTNNGSLNNNLQHKLKVMQQQQGGSNNAAPALNSLSPGQVRGGNVPGSSNQSMVQQQAAQQQILQQLRLAVQSGLISPQLLNYQLPHNILVMLQQLLQLQNALQNLIQRQQFLQQNKVTLNIPRPQLDQVSVMIGQYKSQILNLQKQLQTAQQNMLMKQQPPTAPTPTPSQMQTMSQPPLGMPPPIPTSVQGEGGESIMPLPGDIASGASNAASMSRLSQWKQPTMDKEGSGDLNKAPGSKPQGLQHSHSTPTMGPFGDLTGLNIGGDSTWSSLATSTSSNWPSASAGDSSAEDGGKRENGTPPTSGLAAMLGGGGNLGLSTDVIPEFVPGKPWQGLSSKSVEDDPHITPGSISRSLSVNVVKDDYLNNLTNASKSSPSFSTDATWSTGDKQANPGAAETSMASAMTLGASNLQAQQNRSAAANNAQWQPPTGGYGRQHSWAGRSPSSAFTQVSGSGWDSRQSSSWLLKNLSTQDEEQ
ncbi:uncharacterized protein LOC143292390 isoform X2 [Babylonia areolata]|uniref:uncharacterized protein LOC143292390 isoform X2 n=1 Tax=Babylonia areolata TaxID=304850 RepID=UPI003FCFC506